MTSPPFWSTPVSPLPWSSATTNTIRRRSRRSDVARLAYQDMPPLRPSPSLLACPRRFVVRLAPSSTFSAVTFLSSRFLSAQAAGDLLGRMTGIGIAGGAVYDALVAPLPLNISFLGDSRSPGHRDLSRHSAEPGYPSHRLRGGSAPTAAGKRTKPVATRWVVLWRSGGPHGPRYRHLLDDAVGAGVGLRLGQRMPCRYDSFPN